MKKKYSVSYCIPVYNEERTVAKSIKRISKGLRQLSGIGKYEVLVIDNGSTDSTVNILKRMRNASVHVLLVKEKGYGIAAKTAIQKAQYNYVVLSAIDLPFGFSDVINALPLWDTYDLIYGSKAHMDSVVFSNTDRQIASLIYRFLLKSLFSIQLHDTQGSVFLKRSSVLPFLHECKATNAFFTAQLAIYGYRNHLKMTEVPVSMARRYLIYQRHSKYNVLVDGSHMFYSAIKEFVKVHGLANQ